MIPLRLVPVSAGLLLAALLLFGAPPAAANDLGAEIEARVQRIEILVDEAAALERSGHPDVAKALRARVEGLEQEVRDLRREQERRTRREGERRARSRDEDLARRTVGAFLRFVEAALAEDDEKAEEVVKRLAALAEDFEETRAVPDGHREDREVREHLEHAIELLRAAAKAFAEVENERLVEVMEHAVHAYRLLLEGAEEEAQRLMREHELGRPRLRELLGKAAHLYAGWGQERLATALREFAARIHEEPEDARPAPISHAEALERIGQLQEKVEAIMGLAHAVHGELEELKEALQRSR